MAYQKMTEYTNDQIRQFITAGNFEAFVVDGNKDTRERAARLLKEQNKPQDEQVLTLEATIRRLHKEIESTEERAKEKIRVESFRGLSPIIEDENGGGKRLDLRFVEYLGRWTQEIIQYASRVEEEVFDLRTKLTEPVVLKRDYDKQVAELREELSWEQRRRKIEERMRTDHWSGKHEQHINYQMDQLQEIIDEQQRTIARLQAQLADQGSEPQTSIATALLGDLVISATGHQPQTDEQRQSRVATMTRFLHEQGYGLQAIDPTAEDASIMCTPCGRYFDGGCLLHGVPLEVPDQPKDEVQDDNEPHATDFVSWEQRKQKHLEAVERQPYQEA